MTSSPNLDQMTPEQLRALAAQLLSKVDTMGLRIHRDERIIEQLSHEIVILKRHKFAKRSEQISPAQGSLLDDMLNTDLEAIDAELKALRPALTLDKPRHPAKNSSLFSTEAPQFLTRPRGYNRNIQANQRVRLYRCGHVAYGSQQNFEKATPEHHRNRR